MKLKRVFKIVGLIILTIVGGAAVLAAYLYYQYEGKYEVNREAYQHDAGYIELQNARFVEGFNLCENGRLVGYYSSAAPEIYKGSKYTFRQYIVGNFTITSAISGYLDLRFHINCRGEVGNVEVNELDSDLRPAKLGDRLVEQLVKLSIRNENWQIKSSSTDNYYMYLIYKIENGAVSEILP